MSLKVRSLLVLVVGTVLGLTLSLGGGVLADRQTADNTLPHEEARLLAEVLERVKRDYVDAVDDHELIESAIRGMVSELDPHSQFLDSEQYEEIRISTTGNYYGVGLEVSLEGGQVVVVSPIDETPAQKAGIRSGDVIISIDDMPVNKTELSDTVARMRGRPGTKVSISVLRENVANALDFPLVRSHIKVRSVRHEILDDEVGYIRITHFSETTSRDLRKAVAALKQEVGDKLKGLVLDLRNNPGGVLDAAVEVSDAFLEEGVIVTADGRISDARFELGAHPGDILDGGEMVILVNGGSASASEIVAGALQDHQRASLVGTSTYGKGSVQTVMPLSNGRAIKLTTSRYFTPNGRSIHESGIAPDRVVENDLPVEDDRLFSDEVDGLTRLERDAQLREALDILKGRRILHSKAP